jgi:hypothetical protein
MPPASNVGAGEMNCPKEKPMPKPTKPAPRATEHVCSICRKPYTGYGNNAQPVTNGRCCDDCNSLAVIPTRIRRLYRSAKG